MARTESIALGGFYETPPHLLPLIASYLCLDLAPPPNHYSTPEYIAALDPCAGEGKALAGMVSGVDQNRMHLYAVELERTRAKACEGHLKQIANWSTAKVLHADAFRVGFATKGTSDGGVGLLYLNPPYDQDRDYKRLEARFLARFTEALTPGGVLVFVVPHYALAACAETLAREYEYLECRAFPRGPDFDAFKQVVVFAHRRPSPLPQPSPSSLARVRGWSASHDGLAELTLRAGGEYRVPPSTAHGGPFSEWDAREVDFTALMAKQKPWHATLRGGTLEPMPAVLPRGQIRDCLHRTYPVAVPPRPAHIAAGIAAGVFNGSRIEPGPEAALAGMPPLLVKGVFDREYKTVDVRTNKDGECTGEVQVQQPRLVTTVLDLSARTFHKLKDGVERTAARDLDLMTTADLLADYGEGLMQVLQSACPTLYEPGRDADSVTLAPSPRRPFQAQAHAARALVRVLEEPDEQAILLGEIGSGKSTVSLLAARTRGAKRILVCCPPHLLQSWRNEVASVAPELTCTVLETIADLDRLPPEPFVAILSREAAKLGHAVSQVERACPKCGAAVPPGDLAKKRARCEATTWQPAGTVGRAARDLAIHMTAYSQSEILPMVLRGRFDDVRVRTQPRRETFAPPAPSMLGPALAELVGNYAGNEEYDRLIFLLAAALDRPEWTAMAVACLLHVQNWRGPTLARHLALLLPPTHPARDWKAGAGHGVHDYSIVAMRDHEKKLAAGEPVEPHGLGVKLARDADGVVLISGAAPGSLRVHEMALDALASSDCFHEGKTACGEFLYQAVPEPRRVALAKHIVKYHAGAFDFVILDECHEYATEGSAQERAGHRLSGLRLPTIHMTGSVMNGYAESLFMTLWAVSSDFRREFGREDKQRFIDRFGYRKRLVEDRVEGKVVAYGSQSDRVERCERVIGNAPGVLPLFVLRHLLPVSVTLHKADLAIDLPPCRLERHAVSPTKTQKRHYDRLAEKLTSQIRRDMFTEGLSGKLFGQLAELPSYLDRATLDVGNVEGSGDYEIRYPESVGGELVASAPGLPEETPLPKEAWMLDLIERELAEGRRAMVFTWHLGLLPRIARLLEARLGEACPILYADKVPTAKRQAWIDREIVKKGRRVLVTNPVAIQTGLNNLVHFHTELWLENPACNPLTYRQAIGRVDRIGQGKETRIHFPVYTDTLQEALYTLLMRKVAVSTATDGLDPEAALAAAGLGAADALAGLSIGKQLWAMIEAEERASVPALSA